jgi:hypothetical protein
MLLQSIARILLTWCRLIPQPEMVARTTTLHPSPKEMTDGVMVVVRDNGMEKWACLRCPGGCGERIQLSLSEKRRPRWSVTVDAIGRPTVTPSVHVLNDCRCHFWIRRGAINWVGGSPDRPHEASGQ